jgi:DNA primase
LRAYQLEKGFDLKLCQEAKVINENGKDYFYNRIIFPTFKHGKIIHLTGRVINNNQKSRWLHLSGNINFLFNEDILTNTKEVEITEGIPDCLILFQWNIPAVAILGACDFKEKWIEKFNNCEKVFIST